MNILENNILCIFSLPNEKKLSGLKQKAEELSNMKKNSILKNEIYNLIDHHNPSLDSVSDSNSEDKEQPNKVYFIS